MLDGLARSYLRLWPTTIFVVAESEYSGLLRWDNYPVTHGRRPPHVVDFATYESWPRQGWIVLPETSDMIVASSRADRAMEVRRAIEAAHLRYREINVFNPFVPDGYSFFVLGHPRGD